MQRNALPAGIVWCEGPCVRICLSRRAPCHCGSRSVEVCLSSFFFFFLSVDSKAKLSRRRALDASQEEA